MHACDLGRLRGPLQTALTVCALATLTLLGACGERKPSAAASASAPAAQAADSALLKIPPGMAERFEVATLAEQALESFKEVTGRIEANDRLVTRIGASVTGRVTEVLVEIGDKVQPGQALARVASPELAQAQMAYLRAHSAATLAERAVERARQLFQADVIGSAELQRRESELAMARAEQRASGDQLKLLGIGQAAIDLLRDRQHVQLPAEGRKRITFFL